MSSSSRTSLVLLILCLLVFLSWVGNECVTAKSTKVGDDLRLVEDSEEDEEWLRWGGELEEQQNIDSASPQLVFVQLKPKAERDEKEQTKLAHQFKAKLRLGGYEESVMAVTEDRLLVSCKYANDVGEYMEFFLKHEDVFYFEMNSMKFIWDEDEERPRPFGKSTNNPITDSKPPPPEEKKKRKKKRKKKSKASADPKDEI